MKKLYEAPQIEEIRFTAEDITVVLPDDDLDREYSDPGRGRPM